MGRNDEVNIYRRINSSGIWSCVFVSVGPDVSGGFNSLLSKLSGTEICTVFFFFLHFLSKLCKKIREYNFRICYEIQ